MVAANKSDLVYEKGISASDYAKSVKDHCDIYLKEFGKFLLIYICNFHVLSHLLFIYICKLHWNHHHQTGSVPVIACSALDNAGVKTILDVVTVTHDAWSKRNRTTSMNIWLRELLASQPPPRVAGKALKVNYF